MPGLGILKPEVGTLEMREMDEGRLPVRQVRNSQSDAFLAALAQHIDGSVERAVERAMRQRDHEMLSVSPVTQSQQMPVRQPEPVETVDVEPNWFGRD